MEWVSESEVKMVAKLKLSEDVEIEEKEEYISRELGAVLVNYQTTKFYETNDTGTFIIKLIQGSKTTDEIVAAICAEYDVDQTTAQADVTEFLGKLKQYELIED